MCTTTLVRALALSCHPIPSLAVTALSAGLAALAGLPLGRGAVVTGAVFTGQLSIGWSNDYIDAERDRASLRSDKPLATEAIAPRTVGIAATLAVVFTIALSALLGWPGGADNAMVNTTANVAAIPTVRGAIASVARGLSDRSEARSRSASM